MGPSAVRKRRAHRGGVPPLHVSPRGRVCPRSVVDDSWGLLEAVHHPAPASSYGRAVTAERNECPGGQASSSAWIGLSRVFISPLAVEGLMGGRCSLSVP